MRTEIVCQRRTSSHTKGPFTGLEKYLFISGHFPIVRACTKNETNTFCCKRASAVAQIRILGKAGRRGEEGLPDWSNITRRETTVDLEVGPGDIAAIT